MSVDMCSNKFSEWWQQGEHGWPIEPQCAEYTLAREAFRQGWVAAQNTMELGTTPNSAMVQCSRHDNGCMCVLWNSKECGTKPCLVLAQHQ
jgi:hypothetical protein